MIRTNSARMAIAIATGHGWQAPDWDEVVKLGCRVDRSSKGTNIPGILHNLDCGRVLAGMDACGEIVRDWLMLAYAADGYAPLQCATSVHDSLMAAYWRKHGRSDALAETEGRLGFLAMHQYRCHMRHLDSRLFRPVQIAEKLGIHHQRWSDTWEPRMGRMFDILDGWDRAGLGAVAKMLRSLDGETTTSCAKAANMVA